MEPNEMTAVPSATETGAETAPDVVPLAPNAVPTAPSRPRNFLWHSVSVLTGVLAGFSALLVGHKYFAARIFPAPVVNVNFELVTTPNADFTQAVVNSIGRCRSEILVSARTLSSERILKALQQKAAEPGFSIKVLLDPDTNRSASAGAAGWLNRNKVAEVFVDSHSSTNQFIVFDRAFVFIGSTPLSADAGTSISSTGLFVADEKLAIQLRTVFFERVAQGRALSQ